MSEQWKLGIDMHVHDNVLDGFTFDNVIIALRCNEPVIDERAVRKNVKEMLEIRMQDLNYLIDNNMDEIIKTAKDN